VQVGAGDAAGSADRADALTASNGVTFRHGDVAEVKVGGHETLSVIYVDAVASERKVTYQAHDTAVGGAHRIALGTGQVQAQVPALQLAIEYTSAAKLAGYAGLAGSHEGIGPQPRSFVSAAGDRHCHCRLLSKARSRGGIRPGEARVDTQLFAGPGGIDRNGRERDFGED
jgi:hypothetical protein